MKRTIIDTLRRGFDNTLANWQLSLIRWVEVLVLAAFAVGALFAIFLPVIISIGVNIDDIDQPDDLAEIFPMLLQKWAVLVWIFVALLVLLTVLSAAHAFVEAGIARVLVDADRIAGPAVHEPRTRYRVFSMSKWVAGGKDGWWDVFLIYAAIWGVGALVLLIPAVVLLVLVLLFRESEAAIVAVTCLGLVAFLLLSLLVSLAISMWTNRSIVQWASERRGVGAAVADGSARIRADLGRHVVILLAIVVVSIGGSMVFSVFSIMAALGEGLSGNSAALNLITLPLRIIVAVLSWGFSAAVTNWYLASYAALAVEGHR